MKIKFLILYLIIINIISAFFCFIDKIKARKGSWRIKESTLFTLAFLGGGIGLYFTMKAIRHKTLHKRFMIGIPLIIIAEALILLYFLNNY